MGRYCKWEVSQVIKLIKRFFRNHKKALKATREHMKNGTRPVRVEPSEEQKQILLKHYNRTIDQHNAKVEKTKVEITKKCKKKAREFDLRLLQAVKGQKRFLYFRGLTNTNGKTEFIESNNKRGMKGFKREDLKKVRKNLLNNGLDYTQLTANKMYELSKCFEGDNNA